MEFFSPATTLHFLLHFVEKQAESVVYKSLFPCLPLSGSPECTPVRSLFCFPSETFLSKLTNKVYVAKSNEYCHFLQEHWA